MAVTLLVSEDDFAALTFGVSALAELTAALHVLADTSHHTGLAEWGERTSAALTADLRAEYDAFAFLWRDYRANFLMPAGTTTVAPRFADEVAQVAALPDDRFLREAVAPLGAGIRPGELNGVRSFTRARQLVRAHARARGGPTATLVQDMLTDPAAVRRRLAAFLLQCWVEFFELEWLDLGPALLADAMDNNDLLRARGVYDALWAAVPAAEVDVARGRVTIDKLSDATLDVRAHRLHLIPSAFGWPHLMVQDDPAWTLSVQYPLHRPRRRHDPGPTLRSLQRRLTALDDPVRLQLCRSIAREERSTSELADLWNLSAPQVSRHLKVLRDAGLVDTSRRGHFLLYRLKVEEVARLGPDLLDVLLR